MRILQIIDSLETGGAERMAINYANALSAIIPFSALVATRSEGNLKRHIEKRVAYFFLNKKTTFDFRAVFRLRSFCKAHGVEFVHAHGSSFFLAALLKIVHPGVQIIWHDHYGMSEFLENRKSLSLQVCSFFFKGIISVNTRLEHWARKKLLCKNVISFSNFTTRPEFPQHRTVLNGEDKKRVLCLANLRAQKNHFLLLEVAKSVYKKYPDWSFHLVGKDFKDQYASQLKELISAARLESNVYLYDSTDDTASVIDQCEIAVLTSDSEGLPVVLLEYGLMEKAVVVTNVGEIPTIIAHNTNGLMVAAGDGAGFSDALQRLIGDATLRAQLGAALKATVEKNNSDVEVIQQYLSWINGLR